MKIKVTTQLSQLFETVIELPDGVSSRDVSTVHFRDGKVLVSLIPGKCSYCNCIEQVVDTPDGSDTVECTEIWWEPVAETVIDKASDVALSTLQKLTNMTMRRYPQTFDKLVRNVAAQKNTSYEDAESAIKRAMREGL